jgi:hypothetical protein
MNYEQFAMNKKQIYENHFLRQYNYVSLLKLILWSKSLFIIKTI